MKPLWMFAAVVLALISFTGESQAQRIVARRNATVQINNVASNGGGFGGGAVSAQAGSGGSFRGGRQQGSASFAFSGGGGQSFAGSNRNFASAGGHFNNNVAFGVKSYGNVSFNRGFSGHGHNSFAFRSFTPSYATTSFAFAAPSYTYSYAPPVTLLASPPPVTYAAPPTTFAAPSCQSYSAPPPLPAAAPEPPLDVIQETTTTTTRTFSRRW